MAAQSISEESLPRPKNSRGRRAALWLSTILVCTVCTFAVVEAVYLIVRYHRNGTFQTQHSYDAEAGWRTPVNYRAKSREMTDLLGVTYRRSMETNEVGSRLWGTNPGHRKVLFIGDSFTEADEVSNDKTYYYVFAQKTGLDVYAYGVGGYGTLQELMALERLFPLAQPDVVVLQFCSNDWMNNHAAWERASIAFNQRIRPYYNLKIRRIEYQFPWYHPFTILFRSSAAVGWAVQKTVETLHTMYPHDTFEPDPDFHSARFQESLDVTEYLLGQFAAYIGGEAKLFAFNCSEGGDSHQQHEHFKRIASRQGFRVLDGAIRYVDSHDSATVTTKAATGHFNEHGNHLLGAWLAEHLVKELAETAAVTRAR
jgi:hypothetical protein